jgi:hypothetical protein
MGLNVELHTRLPGIIPEAVQNEPAQKLGLPPIGMTERHNTAAFLSQGPFKGVKEMIFSPQRNTGYAEKEKKVEPDKNPHQKKDRL